MVTSSRSMYPLRSTSYFAYRHLVSRAIIVDRFNGMVMGRISRQRWNANDLVFGKQTYLVTVAPNGTFLIRTRFSL